MLKTMSKKKLDGIVAEFLLGRSSPTTLGYNYFKESVVKAYISKESLSHMNKEIFMPIAEAYKTNSKNIERCIRTFINSWWKKGLKDMGLFPEKPSVKDAVVRIAEAINIQLGSVKVTPDLKPYNFRHVSVYERLFGQE